MSLANVINLETFLRGMETIIHTGDVPEPDTLETFLRGMETRVWWRKAPHRARLETFLRGMETRGIPRFLGWGYVPLKPSLEGWKLRSAAWLDAVP